MIDLDANASTRPLPEVAEAMAAWLRAPGGNASSVHRAGQAARFAVEQARREVAALVNTEPDWVVFTASGTESINLALRGAAIDEQRKTVVVTTVDHPAVLGAAAALEASGRRVIRVRVDGDGRLDRAAYDSALGERAGLVSLTHVNAETGVIEDIAELTSSAHRAGALVHVDAVQSAGKLAVDVRAWDADLVSLSGHKFHGPQGSAALIVREGVALAPLVAGGGQERGLRCGTENVAAIIGMGVAARAARDWLEQHDETVRTLRDRLETGLERFMPGLRVLGRQGPRVDNTSLAVLPDVTAETFLMVLSERGVCASGGSACASGSLEPSHVLTAMGVDPTVARRAVRFSLSRLTTARDIDRTLQIIEQSWMVRPAGLRSKGHE